MEKLLKGDKRFEGKVKRYKAKLTAQGIFANVRDTSKHVHHLFNQFRLSIHLYLINRFYRLITNTSIQNIRKSIESLMSLYKVNLQERYIIYIIIFVS